MHAVTWKPGTDSLYDPLFDHLRERHYRKTDHPLWKNYGKEHFEKECAALSIAFGDHGMPVFCASILGRDCWPPDTYRIINRYFATGFWDPASAPPDHENYDPNALYPVPSMSKENGALALSQMNWLKENTDYKMAFMSRENRYWQKWTIEQFRNHTGLEFKYNGNRYQVCAAPSDDSCFQRIIYQGPDELLEQWTYR
jgi:hypothetical protein